MAAIAPDPTESSAPGWLASFIERWEPGSGELVEDHEPATGRLIDGDVARQTHQILDNIAKALETV